MPQISAPPILNPPPQIFGAYNADGLPISALPDLNGPIFGDGTLLDESNEAKRRRIARVRFEVLRRKNEIDKKADDGRLVICAGRRRSSVMENYQLARIASTTKQNVSLRRSRRRGTLQRGKHFSLIVCYFGCESWPLILGQSEIYRRPRESSRSHGKSAEAIWFVPQFRHVLMFND